MLIMSYHTETSEGLETSLTLRYWGRIRFTKSLLPLLDPASAARTTHRPPISSILGAGYESVELPLDDLDLRLPTNFSMMKVARQAGTLTYDNGFFMSCCEPNRPWCSIYTLLLG